MFNTALFHTHRTTQWVGRELHLFTELVSTNQYLKTHANRYNEGAIIFADHQTNGRGRKGRTWQSPPETSLLFSLLLRPNWSIDRLHWLMMIAGIATVQAIREQTNLPVELKWPNDIIIKSPEGEWQKIGGILVENQIGNDCIEQAIMGIGLNVNQQSHELAEGDLQPTSLRVLGGMVVGREQLLASILQQIETLFAEAERGISPFPQWKDLLGIIGSEIVLKDNGLQGTVTDVTSTGHIVITDRLNAVHTFSLGDISLRPFVARE